VISGLLRQTLPVGFGLPPLDDSGADFVPALGQDRVVHVMPTSSGKVRRPGSRDIAMPYFNGAENVYGLALCGAPVVRPYMRSGPFLDQSNVNLDFVVNPVCEQCQTLRAEALTERQ